MRLAYEVRALYVPREIPSLPRTSDSSFSLKDSSTVQYTLLFYHWTPYPHPHLIGIADIANIIIILVVR